jgi:Ca2+/Na+ antiporter
MRALIKFIGSVILWLFVCFGIAILFVSWTVETRDFNTSHWIWSCIIGIIIYLLSLCCLRCCFNWGVEMQEERREQVKVVPV